MKTILRSKFSKDSFWLLGAQAILFSSGLVVNLLIGSKLGMEDLGVFNQTLSFYLILSTIFSLGINNTILKKVASLNNDANMERQLLTSGILQAGAISTLLTTVFCMICLFFPQLFSSPKLADSLIVVFASMPLFSLNKNFMAYFSGKRNQRAFAAIRGGRWLLIIGFIATGLLSNKSLHFLLFAFLFAESILFLVNVVLLRHQFARVTTPAIFRSNLSFGLKSFSAEIFAVLNEKLDLIIIGYFLSGPAVGMYSFFVFFVKSLYVFPGILQQNVNPIVAHHWENGMISELQQKLSRVRFYNLAVVLFQASLILILYPLFIRHFNSGMKDTYGYLAAGIAGVLPTAAISWGGAVLVMTGKLRENIQRTLMTMLQSLLTTLLFCWLWGLWGATIALCVNSLFNFAIMNVYIRKVTGLRLA